MSMTIEALRQRLQQLKADHEAGRLNAADWTAAREPLERELLALVMAGDAPANGAATSPAITAPAPEVVRPPRRLSLTLSAAVLTLAVAGYAWKGSLPLALNGPPDGAAQIAAAASGEGDQITPEQVTEMVAKLAERLKETPDDAVGWTMLARAYSAMGRHAEAVPAFQKALSLTGDNASLLVDYADTLAAQANGKLAGEPATLVKKALALEPNNLKGLALAGTIAFDEQDYATAVGHWEKVERALPPGSEFVAQVRSSIAQARELGGLPPAPAAAGSNGAADAAGAAGATAAAAGVARAPASAPGTGTATAAAGGGASQASALTGTVNLAPALAAQVNPQDTVFVLARAANGPRMPLAVLRKQVKDLPISFTLDDSMAMAPTARISDHAQVIVSARVSKSGDAIPQPGDLAGQSLPVAPGTRGISLQINAPVDAAPR